MRHQARFSRRLWIQGLCATGLGYAVVGRAADELSKVDDRARAVGLPPFGRSETAHFVGLGDAPGSFRTEALELCETMAEAFVSHFREKGFGQIALPDRRSTVVILASAKSYAAFAGVKEGVVVGGHFDLDADQLVTFDYRKDQASVSASAERINTFTLIHETTHLLSFHTGLLDLRGDSPLCISEGLATYGETWRPRGRGRIGQVNRLRIDGVPMARREPLNWIPIATLLVDDDAFGDAARQQLAYAESWVLLHSHLKSPDRLPRLRAYLAAIKPRRDAKHRLDDARQHLGDLDKLDAEMKRYLTRPIGS